MRPPTRGQTWARLGVGLLLVPSVLMLAFVGPMAFDPYRTGQGGLYAAIAAGLAICIVGTVATMLARRTALAGGFALAALAIGALFLWRFLDGPYFGP